MKFNFKYIASAVDDTNVRYSEHYNSEPGEENSNVRNTEHYTLESAGVLDRDYMMIGKTRIPLHTTNNLSNADTKSVSNNYVKGGWEGYPVGVQDCAKISTAKPTLPDSSELKSSPTLSSSTKKGTKGKPNVRNTEHLNIQDDEIPVLVKSPLSNPFYKAKESEVEMPVDENFVENLPGEIPDLQIDESSHNDFTRVFNQIDLAAVDKELIRAKAELCKKDFAFFIREFWDEVVGEKLIWNWHIDFLASQLQPVAVGVANRRKKDRDIIINIPPGCSKSTIVSIMFPVYCWLVDPTITFISATHEQDLATRQSNASRQLMKCEKFKAFFPHITFKETQDNKTDYENRNGGYRLATSTKSSPTGRHALIIILDDPQNPDTAYSEVERTNVNNWVGGTLSTRKSNKDVCVTITVQQRLHPNDVTGYLLGKEKEYNHICLPAELNKTVQPVVVIPNYVDGMLDPARLGVSVLNDLKVDMGTKTYQTQINQLPNDEENAILKQDWFKIIPNSEWNALLKANKPVIDFYLDTAYTKKTNRDPSAVLACCKIGNDLYVTGVSNVRYEFPKLISHIKTWTLAQGYTTRSKIFVEPKANGLSIVQQLKAETALNVLSGKSSKDDKITRLNGISAIVQAGRVFLVEGHWNNIFLSEVTADDPLHDDIRDCFVAAMENKMVRSQTYGKHVFR